MRTLPLMLALTGCLPKVSLQVLEPGEITLPDEVFTVAVVDRSRAANAGEAVLGAMESVVTGEGPGADARGRQASLQAVVDALDASPRFEVVRLAADPAEVGSSLFDRELSWRVAKRLCDDAGAEALLALEAFDSDLALTVTEPDGADDDWSVVRTTSVTTAWRLYSGLENAILDDVRDVASSDSWTETGATQAKAKAALPPPGDAVAAMGTEAGGAYARRIAPYYVTVRRPFFAAHPDLKQARDLARAGDLEAAAPLWTAAAGSSDPVLAAMGAMGLAVYYESRGNLKKAIDQARAADEALGKGVTRRYVDTLVERRARRRSLREQMAPLKMPEEPEPPPVARPLEAP